MFDVASLHCIKQFVSPFGFFIGNVVFLSFIFYLPSFRSILHTDMMVDAALVCNSSLSQSQMLIP
jgi:hypothetical protein